MIREFELGIRYLLILIARSSGEYIANKITI
jgi:hypothetical protein